MKVSIKVNQIDNPVGGSEYLSDEIQKIIDSYDKEYVQKYFNNAVKSAYEEYYENALEKLEGWQHEVDRMEDLPFSIYVNGTLKFDKKTSDGYRFSLYECRPKEGFEYYIEVIAEDLQEIKDEWVIFPGDLEYAYEEYEEVIREHKSYKRRRVA